MKPLILGCDPGFSGAISVYDSKNQILIDVFDMPVEKIRGKNEINAYTLGRFIDGYSQDIDFLVIEDVGVMTGKEGRSSMFRFGEGVGIMKGIVASYNIPIFAVVPSVWKSVMNLSRDKSASLDKARKLFPNKIGEFKRQKDEGRAEAALLAYFGLRFKC